MSVPQTCAEESWEVSGHYQKVVPCTVKLLRQISSWFQGGATAGQRLQGSANYGCRQPPPSVRGGKRERYMVPWLSAFSILRGCGWNRVRFWMGSLWNWVGLSAHLGRRLGRRVGM